VTRLKVEAPFGTQTEICMKVNSKKTRAMASESIPVKMARSLKDYGKTMCKMARDRQIGLMVQVIPEST
jgi:hypothetical protein